MKSKITEQEEYKNAMVQMEMDKLNKNIKEVTAYLMKWYVPKAEFTGVFATQGAIEIINIIKANDI